jgi:hypothetical protein
LGHGSVQTDGGGFAVEAQSREQQVRRDCKLPEPAAPVSDRKATSSRPVSPTGP